MDATTFRLGGVVLSAPVTAGTNLLLALICGLFHARLRGAARFRERWWGRFFLFLCVSTLLGVPKHALSHYGEAQLHRATVLGSNLAVGVATYASQRAAVRPGAGAWRAPWVLRAAPAQLAAYAALMIWLRLFMLVVVNTAVGLALVLVAELRGARMGRTGSGRISAGLSLGLLPGAAYLLGVSMGPWLGPIDLAHVLMMPCLILVYRGARSGAGPRARTRGALREESPVPSEALQEVSAP